MTSQPAYADLLAEEVSAYYADPLGFVYAMYPWGEPGELEKESGPDVWQTEFLERLGQHVLDRKFDGEHAVDAIRMAASKGHGVGGSALAAWIVDWVMSTRPHAQGTVTANTNLQLQTKTWAAVKRWTKLCKTAHWFVINDDRMYRIGFKESWFCAPASCGKENSEAFAGQHAKNSTSFYINDEDSGVPNEIHEVQEGGLTDGEPMQFLFGNATRASGPFYERVFGKLRHRYDSVIVDSRTSKLTNKQQIAQWIEDYGLDSDFIRVRVLGLPPKSGDLQFIGLEAVQAAQKRALIPEFDDEPLIAGADFADGGSAWNIVRFRRGADARSFAPIRVPGSRTADDDGRAAFIAQLAGILRDGVVDTAGKRHKVAMLFCDSAFGARYVDRLKAMGYANVDEVRFGQAPTPDDPLPNDTKRKKHYGNMRAFMWGSLKAWLDKGALDPADSLLETDLTAPGYYLNRQDYLILESKEDMAARGVASPDDGDALALTFAAKVRAPKQPARQVGHHRMPPSGDMAWGAS